ncbi:MAG: FtsX-like permease family protein [Pirellulaceae bacterium]
MVFGGIPLAWKNLTHDPRRLVVACGGVSFAVLLMYMELGFLNALLDSNVELVRRLEADLIIVNKARFSLVASDRFPLPRLYQVRGKEGIRVFPLYLESAGSVLRRQGEKGYSIRAIAFDLDHPLLEPDSVAAHKNALRTPGMALADTKSHPDYGIPQVEALLPLYTAELNGQKLRLAGRFTLCTDFGNDGNLLMSEQNFARFFPLRDGPGGDPLRAVDLGIVQVKPGATVSLKDLQAQLVNELPGDVAVFTKQEFIKRERRFWSVSTPVGYIFLVGTVIGFVVGVIICYQIIHADIADHLPEFATLKAMGYSTFYFIWLVIGEGLYLSLIGFIPGAFLSYALYMLLAWRTGLLMEFRPDVSGIVLVSTMVMCVSSGVFALRKLLLTDPASLF